MSKCRHIYLCTDYRSYDSVDRYYIYVVEMRADRRIRIDKQMYAKRMERIKMGLVYNLLYICSNPF